MSTTLMDRLERSRAYTEPNRSGTQLAHSLLGAAKPGTTLWAGSASGPRTVKLFGMSIDNVRLSQAACDLAVAAHDGRRTRVAFVNAHVVNTAMSDPAYMATITGSDRIYADGSGMAVAARLAGQPLADNVNGTDLFPVLCQQAIAQGQRIFLLGGRPGIASSAAQTIAEFGMAEAIAGTHHGYFTAGTSDEDKVIARINASSASIVLVGLGVPLQDSWAERNAARLKAPVIAGVGGLFDFFSGAVSRSPKFMRTLGCEWMWRLALEPRRMANRYLVGNVVFLGHSVLEARATRRNHTAGSPALLKSNVPGSVRR